MAFEELDFTLMLLGGFAGFEGAKVAALAGFGVGFTTLIIVVNSLYAQRSEGKASVDAYDWQDYFRFLLRGDGAIYRYGAAVRRG